MPSSACELYFSGFYPGELAILAQNIKHGGRLNREEQSAMRGPCLVLGRMEFISSPITQLQVKYTIMREKFVSGSENNLILCILSQGLDSLSLVMTNLKLRLMPKL